MSPTRLLDLSAASYEPHELHRTDRLWDQTNCSVDVWIEVLHALGLDPLAAAAFTVAADFEGDQWTFFKYPPEDLWSTYGIDVHEMNPWRGTLSHVCDQLELGRLMTLEVDSWFLPDTAGVAYRLDHAKSTIVPNFVDAEAARLGYFHNSGYHELEGEDFDGVFRIGPYAGLAELPPYTEVIRLENLRCDDAAALTAQARRLLVTHLARRPVDNPVERLAAGVDGDLEWLRSAGADSFHKYAFATVRQCGASAATAGAFCSWLAGRDHGAAQLLAEAATHWLALAEGAKSAQMKLARVARGRTSALAESWDQMDGHWAAAQALLDRLRDS